jgi:tetrahydromethanopterin S-methyltransferase subunit B
MKPTAGQQSYAVAGCFIGMVVGVIVGVGFCMIALHLNLSWH